jgi:hypothetical protein
MMGAPLTSHNEVYEFCKTYFPNAEGVEYNHCGNYRRMAINAWLFFNIDTPCVIRPILGMDFANIPPHRKKRVVTANCPEDTLTLLINFKLHGVIDHWKCWRRPNAHEDNWMELDSVHYTRGMAKPVTDEDWRALTGNVSILVKTDAMQDNALEVGTHNKRLWMAQHGPRATATWPLPGHPKQWRQVTPQ